jgi:hypothetical protein
MAFFIGNNLGSFWMSIEKIKELPSFYEVMLDIPACFLIQEITFYYSHR